MSPPTPENSRNPIEDPDPRDTEFALLWREITLLRTDLTRNQISISTALDALKPTPLPPLAPSPQISPTSPLPPNLYHPAQPVNDDTLRTSTARLEERLDRTTHTLAGVAHCISLLHANMLEIQEQIDILWLERRVSFPEFVAERWENGPCPGMRLKGGERLRRVLERGELLLEKGRRVLNGTRSGKGGRLWGVGRGSWRVLGRGNEKKV